MVLNYVLVGCPCLSARDAVEDEESPNSREDDTSSEFSDSDDSSNDSSTYESLIPS